ncbi:MAG TPA: ferritin-like domain-containing protein [Candidatus Binatia bacterium]|jgi:hypothetical protein
MSWKTEDIDFDRVVVTEIKDDRNMLLILAGSSFLEITAPLYTSNLLEFNRGGGEIIEWLKNVWMPEELEHGRAMKTYVEKVWPAFDWEHAYRSFLMEFAPRCRFERYQESRALEMLARCVTETGAATFYKSLRDATNEPVLKDLLDRMQRDEIRHYKYFLRFFRYYNSEEQNSRAKLLKGLLMRATRVYDEDMFIACKYARNDKIDGSYRESVRSIRAMTRRHYPVEQAVKMLAQPFDLSPTMRKFPVFVLRSLSAVL